MASPSAFRYFAPDSPGGSRVRDERPWRIEPDGSPSEYDHDRAATGTPSARLRHTDSNSYLQQQEALINSYEAEEERIINSLVRKLEEVSTGAGYGWNTDSDIAHS